MRGVKQKTGYATSRALLVVLGVDGMTIHGFGPGPLLLAPAHLLLLAEVSRGALLTEAIETAAAATGTDPDVLEEFASTLIERGLLLDRAGPSVALAAEMGPASDGHVATDEPLLASLPLVVGLRDGQFELIDHDGKLTVRLTASELALASQFAHHATIDEVAAVHAEQLGDAAVRRGELPQVAARLVRSGVLRRYDPDDRLQTVMSSNAELQRDVVMTLAIRTKHFVDQVLDRRDDEEAERIAAGAKPRVRVWPMHRWSHTTPLALGLVLSHAMAYEGGRLSEQYDFRPDWASGSRDLAVLTDQPGVFLFSNYIWSSQASLDLAGQIKAVSPGSVTIHGGPNVPGYQADTEDYFAANPQVDVTVRGEGEATLAEILDALAGRIDGDPVDLSILEDVRGISFRHEGRVVRTPDRDRIADLNIVPSPYLNGLFDAFGDGRLPAATIETNRGCPYGCTFCDWGSNTLSRIRKLDLDRVFAELEWCAQNKVFGIGLSDANFGIMERDVEIAQKVADLKAEYGYPWSFDTNYAKNTTKHLRKIVSILAEAGIITQGVLSLQTQDPDTLVAVRRKNIKVERYNELENQFREARLPLFIDLMMGLPGQTINAFRDDLQDIVERDVTAKIHPTVLLVNSPMNDPAYKAEHGIRVAQEDGHVWSTNSNGNAVVASTTFDEADYDTMKQWRRWFFLFENAGVLRQVSRYVRQEAGLPEMAFYDRLASAAVADRERWPLVAYAFSAVPDLMVPPLSWTRYLDEVGEFLTEELGVSDDPALGTVLAVQAAVLPSPGRSFPVTLELPHDFGAWHRDRLAARGADGHWSETIPHLREYPPGTFTVDDPQNLSVVSVGRSIEMNYMESWELESVVARPLKARLALPVA